MTIEKIPTSLVQGQTLTVEDTLSGASSATLHFRGTSTDLQVPAKMTGQTARMELTTANIDPGQYTLEIFAKLAGGTDTLLLRGQLEIKPPVEAACLEYDSQLGLSQAERIVVSLENYIERGAASPHKRYKINNRELERYSMSELLSLLNYYRRRAAEEKRKREGRSRGRVMFSL